MKIRSAANMPKRVRISFPEDEGRTKQSMLKECDINNIVKKYQKTGAIDHFARHQGRYDFATSGDFHTALNIVTEANTMFEELPSKLRSKFETPSAFLDFVQNEANGDEMVELGLRDPNPTVAEELPPAPAAPAPAETAQPEASGGGED